MACVESVCARLYACKRATEADLVLEMSVRSLQVLQLGEDRLEELRFGTGV